MCLQAHGAVLPKHLLEAGELLLIQRQERAAAPTAQEDAPESAGALATGGHEAVVCARRRLRTSLFYKSGPIQLLSDQQVWITTWSVLSHGLLILYDSQAGSGAGIEHELRRCNLGDECSDITFAPVGGGEDRAGDLISIVTGEGDASAVTRLSAGSSKAGAEWWSSLKAQAHNLNDGQDTSGGGGESADGA